jgi:YVTN family beta-propeller protein
VYVANTGDNSISVIETATNTVAATIDVGPLTFSPVFPNGPQGPPYSHLAITPDGSRVYVTNTFPYNQPYSSSLKVVDTATRTVVTRVQLSQRNSGSVALTGDGSIGYVAGWYGYFQVFNVLANSQVDAFTLSGGNSGISLAGIAIPASGPYVYVAASEHNSVYAINPLTRSGIRVPVGLYPTDVSIAPDGSVAYVTNRADGTVSVIELATNAVVATIGVGRFPSKVAFIASTAAKPDVSWAPGPLAYGRPVGAGQLNAISNVAGTFSYSVSAGTFLSPGAHSFTARFTPDDRERYQEVVVTATITVADNQSPTLLVGGPHAAYAGTLLPLNAAASDPDGDAVSVQWDLDGDGIFETFGPRAILIVPANSTNVAVRAVDQWGKPASAVVSVHVIAAGPGPGPNPTPGPIDPYFVPRPSFIEWDASSGGLRANYGPRFDAAQLPTTCAVASNMLGVFPLWQIHHTGFLLLDVEIRPNYSAFVEMVRAMPPAYKYVAIGFAVKCAGLPIPGGAALASQLGLSLDCPQLRQLYKDLVGEWPEETLANALPIPDRLRTIIRTRLVLCPFKLDLSGYGCQEKIEIAGELAELLLPGLGSLLNSPVGKFLANALLCDGVEIPDVSFEFPEIDWGFGDPGCWFGCGSGGDGGGDDDGDDDGDGGGGSGGSGGSGGGSGDFHWERLPSFGEGNWDWITVPPSPPTGPGNYVDCALVPADWQLMTWGQFLSHGALRGASPMTMLDVLAACTMTEPVRGLPFRSDISVSMVGPTSALVGDVVAYDLTVRAAGPGGAPLSRVMVTAATAFEVVPADGPCRSLSSNSARCDFGTVAVGTARTIPLSLRFASGGSVEIRAGVVSYVADSNLADNVASLDVIVEKRIPSVDWAPAPLVYGNPIGAAQLNALAVVGGSFSYSLAPGTRLPAGTHPASVVFTPDDQARYATVTKSAAIDIGQAPLTVTVNDVSREFGAPNPSFTAGYDGLVGGETPAVLGGVLTFSTAATPSSPVGTYAVSASGLISTNYAITYSSGSLLVVDTTAPVIDSVIPSIGVLWPPNQKMVGVTVRVSAADMASGFSCSVSQVSSNEPVNGTGDGDTGPDWEITGSNSVDLRAERSGSGSGRLYSVRVECRDTHGNASTANTTVSVPRDRR